QLKKYANAAMDAVAMATDTRYQARLGLTFLVSAAMLVTCRSDDPRTKPRPLCPVVSRRAARLRQGHRRVGMAGTPRMDRGARTAALWQSFSGTGKRKARSGVLPWL